MIRLIRRKCSRRLGRQSTAESAFGDILIQQIDAEQVYGKFLEGTVEVFEREPAAATLVYKDIFCLKSFL